MTHDYIAAYLKAHPAWAQPWRLKALSAWRVRREKDATAIRFLRAHPPSLTFADAVTRLESIGIVRNSTWVSDRMFELLRERAEQWASQAGQGGAAPIVKDE